MWIFIFFIIHFSFLMVFFLKEAVHQRAFCSYIVFFFFFFTEENTVQPFFFFFSKQYLVEHHPNTWFRAARSLCLPRAELGREAAISASSCWSYMFARDQPEGGFDSFFIFNTTIQEHCRKSLFFFFKRFYLKSQFILVFLISVPCLSLVHPFPFVVFFR